MYMHIYTYAICLAQKYLYSCKSNTPSMTRHLSNRAIVHINVIKLSQREVVHESNYLGSTLCGVQKHKRD